MSFKDYLLTESTRKENTAFIRKIYGMAQPNPLGGGYFFYLKGDKEGEEGIVKFELHSIADSVHITEIVVADDKGGQGFGDYIMKIITKEADKMDVDLDLNAVPLAHAGKKIPKGKLIKFYKKHGFEIESGDHMVRRQRKPIKLSGKMKQINF